MRTRLLAILATASLVVLLGATSARADQITLGDSCTSGSLTVGPGPNVGGSVSGCHATWEQGLTDTSVTPWSLTNGTSIDITDSGTNTLMGTINWTNFGNDTLDGWVTVTSVNGFNGEYSVGGVYHIDLTFQQGSCSAPNSDGFITGCLVSSGEIPTPEPGTLTLLGTGLLTMAGFVRRKLRS